MADAMRLELILNRRVRALNGRVMGRLEELIAEVEDGECRVDEYLIGVYGLSQRLAAWRITRALLRFLRVTGRRCGYRVRWNQLNVSDPTNLRLGCPVSELEEANRAERSRR
jgi:hypothetical protein